MVDNKNIEMYNAEKLLPSIKVIVNDDREQVPILFLGDVHLGHANFNQTKFEKTLNWAKENDAYFIYMGDMIESVPNLKFGIDSIEDCVIDVESQRDLIVNYLKPFSSKNLIYLTGNHEWRTMRNSGIDISKHIAKSIGAVYAGWGTLASLDFGEVSYGIALHHGRSSSVYPQYELKKLDLIFEDYDVMAIGHIHQLYHEVKQRLGLNGENKIEAKDRHWIRTGSFLKYAPYAFRKVLPVMKNGCPIVYFSTKTREVHVDASGSVGGNVGTRNGTGDSL